MRFLFIFFTLLFVLNSTEISEPELKIQSGKIIFLSEAPQETIKGIGKLISGKIQMKEKSFQVEIDLTDWKTNNKLQTSHLHENYLETDKFPMASYKGNFTYDAKSGESELNGTMKIHGVEKKNFIIKGKINKSSEGYQFTSNFIINLKDFNIEIPKLLFLKINENIKLETNIQLK